jgi:hypothetical protein
MLLLVKNIKLQENCQKNLFFFIDVTSLNVTWQGDVFSYEHQNDINNNIRLLELDVYNIMVTIIIT